MLIIMQNRHLFKGYIFFKLFGYFFFLLRFANIGFLELKFVLLILKLFFFKQTLNVEANLSIFFM